MYGIFEEFVPRSSIHRSNKPMWFNKELSHLKNVRNREYKKRCKMRTVNHEADSSDFTKTKNEFDERNLQLYSDYIN